MAKATTRLTDDAMAFLTERHLAMLTTLRADNSPHVVAVGFTFDPKTHIARVITTGGSQKAVNADERGVAVLSQVDGARWLSLEGKASVNSETEAVRDAELRYAQRYRTPRVNPKRGFSARPTCSTAPWTNPPRPGLRVPRATRAAGC
jgi:F420H(2)-dependent biliverdin reductase